MQTKDQKQQKVRIAKQVHNKLIGMIESDPQNKQMVIDTFADNAKFKYPQYQTKQAKIKYFQTYFKEIIFASIYKSTFTEVNEFTDFIIFFYDWIEKHQFPLKMKNQTSSAKKPTDEKIVDEKQQQKKAQLYNANTANINTSREKTISFQVQKPNTTQLPSQRAQIQQQRIQSKQIQQIRQREREPQYQKNYSPISQPHSNRNLISQPRQQSQGRGGISPTPISIYNAQIKSDNRYQQINYQNKQQTKQHFSQNQPSKQQITKKILAKIYQCYDQPEKRHIILSGISLELQNLKRMEGVMKIQKPIRR